MALHQQNRRIEHKEVSNIGAGASDFLSILNRWNATCLQKDA
jgi:hypothetical protein